MNAQIISGTYTVVSAKTGAHRTVAIMDDDFEWMTNYKPVAGTRVVKAMLGSDNERLTSIGVFTPAGELRIWKKHESRNDLIAALRYVIAKGAEERVQLGKTYAVMSKRCFICNRKLTNPASHFYGYGPDCAEQNDLPYDRSAGSETSEGASAPEPVGDVLAQASAVVASNKIGWQTVRPARTFEQLFGAE